MICESISLVSLGCLLLTTFIGYRERRDLYRHLAARNLQEYASAEKTLAKTKPSEGRDLQEI